MDPFGQMLLDQTGPEIVERDDGFISASMLNYFAPVRRWAAVERRALRWVRGRVLDVGVGAGRVALELQARGREVVGIDISPGAVQVARSRGVSDVRQLAFEDVDESLGRFDTLVLFGNNFGLFGSRAKARRLLRRLRPFVGRIVAASNDPYATDDSGHFAYQGRNRARGRMSGQLRLRVRYRDLVGPWFEYLIVSPDELAKIVEGTGWQIRHLIRDPSPSWKGTEGSTTSQCSSRPGAQGNVVSSWSLRWEGAASSRVRPGVLPAKMDDAGGGLRGLRARLSQRLLDVIGSRYGIDCGSHPVDLGGSSNLNLLVGVRAERFVARVYRPYVTAERLRDTHVVRSVLDAAGVPCGGLVPTLDGQAWVVFDGRLVEVERFVERDAEMDSWERLEIGLPMLGRIHTVLRDLNVGDAGRSPMFANHVDSSEALERTLRGTRRIRAWDSSPLELRLAADAEELARLVARAERPLTDHLPRQLVHGDFWDNNVFFRSGRVVFVTDFDFMGERARVDDLALTLFFTCMEFLEEPVSDDQLGRLRRLIDAYDAGSGDPLTATERAALPLAIARQPLWSIGGWVASLDDEEAARQHAAAVASEARWP